MQLYLVRHGEAYSQEENPERPLNDYGKQEVAKIGQFLKKTDIPIDYIYHSDKRRAKETAQILSQHLSMVHNVDHLSCLDPEENIEKLTNTIAYLKDNTLLVGHLPNLELLCSFLLTQTYQKPIILLHTAAVACLKFEDPNWILKWLINPSLLT